MLEPEPPPQRAQQPLQAALAQATPQGRGLTWLRALGCPVTELPTRGAGILGCGSGLTTPKTLSFFLPLLLPYLVGTQMRLTEQEARQVSGSIWRQLPTCLRRSLPLEAGPRA